MIGELLSGLINLAIGCVRLFQYRLVVVMKSQYGCLVRRRNRHAIIVGHLEKPQYIVATSKAFADTVSIMELDNKIHDVIQNPGHYTKALILRI